MPNFYAVCSLALRYLAWIFSCVPNFYAVCSPVFRFLVCLFLGVPSFYAVFSVWFFCQCKFVRLEFQLYWVPEVFLDFWMDGKNFRLRPSYLACTDVSYSYCKAMWPWIGSTFFFFFFFFWFFFILNEISGFAVYSSAPFKLEIMIWNCG